MTDEQFSILCNHLKRISLSIRANGRPVKYEYPSVNMNDGNKDPYWTTPSKRVRDMTGEEIQEWKRQMKSVLDDFANGIRN